jgi:F-type H+-transporting ATPase subunit delta
LSRVAIRYSKALFELALEQDSLEQLQSDLKMIKGVCSEHPEFQDALTNPLIAEGVKARLLEELFSENVQPLTFRFLQLVSQKKRSGFLLEMIDHFLERVLDYQDIVSGILISAKPLDEEQVSAVRKNIELMTKKTVLLSEQVDENLIGGFIVRIKDTVIDLSIKTQLEKLRGLLVHG